MKNILLLITLLSIVSCKNSNSAEVVAEKEIVSDKIVEDTTIKAITKNEVDGVSGATNVENDITLNGIVTVPPQQYASVTSNLSGAIHSISLMAGNYVNRGSVVVTLETPEFILLQQSYLEALAQCEYLEQEYNRQKNLSMQEAASQKKFQMSKAEYFSMKSKLDAAKAQLTLLNVNLEKLVSDGISPYLEVKSPISGSITNLGVNVGKYVNAGDIICDVVNKQAVMLELTAYDKDLGYLNVGDSLSFYVNGLRKGKFSAIISSIDKVVDKTNRSIKVYAKVLGDVTVLNAGMYVSAVILRKNK